MEYIKIIAEVAEISLLVALVVYVCKLNAKIEKLEQKGNKSDE